MEGIGEILCESCESLQKSRKISQNVKKGGRKRGRTSLIKNNADRNLKMKVNIWNINAKFDLKICIAIILKNMILRWIFEYDQKIM